MSINGILKDLDRASSEFEQTKREISDNIQKRHSDLNNKISEVLKFQRQEEENIRKAKEDPRDNLEILGELLSTL